MVSGPNVFIRKQKIEYTVSKTTYSMLNINAFRPVVHENKILEVNQKFPSFALIGHQKGINPFN